MKRIAILTAAVFIGLSAFSPLHADEFEDKLTSLLNKKPEIVINALEAYQKKLKLAKQEEQKANLKKHRVSLEGDNLDFIANPDGSKTLVEFFDYNCGYCKQAAASVEKIRSDVDNKIVYIEFPVLGEGSTAAAKYAIAMKMMDGPYLELHEKFMTTKRVTSNTIKVLLKEIGQDPAAVAKVIAENEAAIEMKIQKNMKLAEDLGISGTPAFVVGDVVVPGAAPYPALRGLLERTKG